MSESQDLTKPIIDPILLITEGSASLPERSSDIAPLDSLKDFDSACTVDVFAKLHQRDQQKISQQRLLEAYQEGNKNEEGPVNVRRKQHTVLSKINDQWTRGPISILHKALTNKLRVKVWVRNHSTVRSILTGFVAAFDKHLNLALVDVDEAICLRKDNIKSTTLTPEQDLRDLRPVHNEQEYLSIANADLEVGDECAEEDEHNENDGTDAELAAEKNTNDSEDIYNNNDVSREHSLSETDVATSAAERIQTAGKELSNAKTAARAGSDPIKETEQKDSEEQQRRKKLCEKLPAETRSSVVGESAEIRTGETVKCANRNRSGKKIRGRVQKSPPSLTQRFIPQLFVRGEQVVMIAFADM